MVAVARDFRRIIYGPVERNECILRLAADDKRPADSIMGGGVVRVQGRNLPTRRQSLLTAEAANVGVEPRQGESRIGEPQAGVSCNPSIGLPQSCTPTT